MRSPKWNVLALALGAIGSFTAVACSAGSRTRIPRLDFRAAGGCGDIFVYKSSEDRLEAVVVVADKNLLGLQVNETSFDLKDVRQGLEVWVDVFARRPVEWPYCNDIVNETDEPPTRWKAVAGRVTIKLDRAEGVPEGQYRAIVRLEEAVFEDSRGRSVRQLDPILIDAVVGWYAG